MTPETKTRLALERFCTDVGRAIAKAMPAEAGFALLVFDYGPRGSMTYTSSAQRSDMIKALRELISRLELVDSDPLHSSEKPERL